MKRVCIASVLIIRGTFCFFFSAVLRPNQLRFLLKQTIKIEIRMHKINAITFELANAASNIYWPSDNECTGHNTCSSALYHLFIGQNKQYKYSL